MKEEKHIELNKAKWDKWSESVDGKSWLYDYLRKAQKSLLTLVELREGTVFLDLGCGTGQAVVLAAKSVNYEGSFYGVDLSAGMIEKAKENFSEHENFHFIIANSESIPIEDNFFDNIICSNSFHHYLHPDKAMNEICRLLKPGGRIYILDPIADTWFIKIIDKIIKLVEPQHVKIYSTEEFKKLMTDAGLKHAGFKTFTGKQKVQIGEKQITEINLQHS